MRTSLQMSIALALLLQALPYSADAATGDLYARVIRALIPEAPEMVAIAQCESELRQFTGSGSVLRGGLGGQMIGLFQFHEKYHRAPALALGYNIDTAFGNISYARELFRAQGTTPWNSSAHCWQEKTATSLSSMQKPGAITQALRYGMTHPEIALLKDVLVAQGYLPHSIRSSTTYFDTATLKALVDFQCAERIACVHGGVGMQGIGRVSGATLTRINALLTNSPSAKLSGL